MKVSQDSYRRVYTYVSLRHGRSIVTLRLIRLRLQQMEVNTRTIFPNRTFLGDFPFLRHEFCSSTRGCFDFPCVIQRWTGSFSCHLRCTMDGMGMRGYAVQQCSSVQWGAMRPARDPPAWSSNAPLEAHQHVLLPRGGAGRGGGGGGWLGLPRCDVPPFPCSNKTAPVFI